MWKRKSDKRRFYLRGVIKNAKYWSAKIQNWFGDFYVKLLSECRGLCHTKVCLILNLPDFLIQICDRLKLKTDSCRWSTMYQVFHEFRFDERFHNIDSFLFRGYIYKGAECDLIGRSVSFSNCNFCLKRIHVILKIDFHQRFITKW